MLPYQQLSSGFHFDLDIEQLERLPVVSKSQGEPAAVTDPAVLTGAHWLRYSVYPGGSISFSRNTWTELPELCYHAARFMDSCFDGLAFDPRRVHVLRTVGPIRAHRDEGGRRAAINIGARYTNTAITRISTVHEANDLEHSVDLVCEDHQAYLIDTSALHTVISGPTAQPRYLLTYSMDTDYLTAFSRYKGH